MSDTADYCRQVEAHLTRVNGGHLVRVVGPGFALVRQWAEEGIPLSIVFRGIEQKADRHSLGAARRPLRIEFCEADVRELFDTWRRAVGLSESAGGQDVLAGGRDVLAGGRVFRPGESAGPEGPARSKSPSKTIDKAIERLGRVGGRLDLPDEFRDHVSHAIERLSAVREGLAHSRGAARDPWLAQLAPIDHALVTEARRIIDVAVLRDLTDQAERDMAPYRDRMAPEAWQRAVTLTTDRGVRAHLGLPVLEV